MRNKNIKSAARMAASVIAAIFLMGACSQCNLKFPYSPLEPDPTRNPDQPDPVVELTAPTLVSPANAAVLDNGRTDQRDKIAWDFSWNAVQGATGYHLYVIHSGSPIPAIDNGDVTGTLYHYENTGYISNNNRHDWRWKVRAVGYDSSTGATRYGPWSEERSFDVEPVNTDHPW
jgi:hypothetical protein